MTTFGFYSVTVGFILGIALASTTPVGVFGALLFLIIGAGFIGIWFLKRDVVYFAAALLFLMCSLGAFRFEMAERLSSHDLDHYETEDVNIEGVVLREPDRRETTTHLYIEVAAVNDTAVRGTILAFHDRFSKVQYGDRITLRGMLAKPEKFETEFGRTFDYPGYLKAQGVSHTVFRPNIQVISSGAGSSIVSALLLFKHRLSESIEATLLAPESGLALGILLGEKQSLGKEVLSSFRDAGLIHIVVLSGYNIAILIEAMMRLLAFISLRLRTVLAGAVIVLFVLMVGPSATVLRAAVMAVLVLLARATKRTYAILRALMVAGTLMLFVNPYLLRYDPGFQLSFLATLGLILVAPLLERTFHFVPTVGQVKEFVIATIATQITVLPLLAFSMGSVSTVALIANVVVLPLIPLAMLLSALVGASGLMLPSLAHLIGYPADILLAFIITVSEQLARVPYAALSLPSFPFIFVIIAYVAIGGVVYRVSMQSEAKTNRGTKNPAPKTETSSRDPFPFA